MCKCLSVHVYIGQQLVFPGTFLHEDYRKSPGLSGNKIMLLNLEYDMDSALQL